MLLCVVAPNGHLICPHQLVHGWGFMLKVLWYSRKVEALLISHGTQNRAAVIQVQIHLFVGYLLYSCAACWDREHN